MGNCFFFADRDAITSARVWVNADKAMNDYSMIIVQPEERRNFGGLEQILILNPTVVWPDDDKDHFVDCDYKRTMMLHKARREEKKMRKFRKM